MKKSLWLATPLLCAVLAASVVVWSNQGVGDPPTEAKELIEKYERDAREIQEKADQALAARRENLIADLKKLEQTYLNAGKKAAARVVSEQIALLKEGGVPVQGTVPTPLDDPGVLTGLRAQAGKVLFFRVTGANSGAVWGTGIYTDDSTLASAAVHAGVLKLGEKGIVKVTLLPGQTTYTSSQQNGIRSGSWGSWSGSFKVEAVGGGGARGK